MTNNGLCNNKPYKNAILSSVCDMISELIDNNKRIGRVSFFVFFVLFFIYIYFFLFNLNVTILYKTINHN